MSVFFLWRVFLDPEMTHPSAQQCGVHHYSGVNHAAGHRAASSCDHRLPPIHATPSSASSSSSLLVPLFAPLQATARAAPRCVDVLEEPRSTGGLRGNRFPPLHSASAIRFHKSKWRVAQRSAAYTFTDYAWMRDSRAALLRGRWPPRGGGKVFDVGGVG